LISMVEVLDVDLDQSKYWVVGKAGDEGIVIEDHKSQREPPWASMETAPKSIKDTCVIPFISLHTLLTPRDERYSNIDPFIPAPPQTEYSATNVLSYSPLAFQIPTSPSSPPATTISPSQSPASNLSPNLFPLAVTSLLFPLFWTENKADLGDLISQICTKPEYVTPIIVNVEVGWHFNADIGEPVGKTETIEEVEDGLGSYIDIVLSIDPVATVPFWDVERDRIDLSLGPAYLSAEFAGLVGERQWKGEIIPRSEDLGCVLD
jgi:hypothetical protein